MLLADTPTTHSMNLPATTKSSVNDRSLASRKSLLTPVHSAHEQAWTSTSSFSPSRSFLRINSDRIDRDLQSSSRFHRHSERWTYWWNDTFQIRSNLGCKCSHRRVGRVSNPTGDRCRVRSLSVSLDMVPRWTHEDSLRNFCPWPSRWSTLGEWTEGEDGQIRDEDQCWEFTCIRVGIAILWSRFEFQWFVLEDLD